MRFKIGCHWVKKYDKWLKFKKFESRLKFFSLKKTLAEKVFSVKKLEPRTHNNPFICKTIGKGIQINYKCNKD
jgi:hypothetical protein